MCALRAHIKPSNFRNIFLEIKKAVNTFSIFKKIFPNIGGLMCALRAHINQTIIYLLLGICTFSCFKYQGSVW